MACCNFLLKKIGIEKQTIWDKIDVLLGTSLKTQWELDGKGLGKKKTKQIIRQYFNEIVSLPKFEIPTQSK